MSERQTAQTLRSALKQSRQRGGCVAVMGQSNGIKARGVLDLARGRRLAVARLCEESKDLFFFFKIIN